VTSALSAHLDVVRISTEHYVADLQTALPRIRPAAQEAVRNLIGALDAALSKGYELTVDDVPFGVDILADADLQPEEVDLLRNQFTVGSGAPDTRVIAMGTEEGYEPAAKGLDLALWNCTNGLLWLSGSPLSVVQRLARGIPEATRRAGVDLEKAESLRAWAKAVSVKDDRWPCHRYPIRWASLLGPVHGGRSTWGILADILGVSLVELDDCCYQVDRSVAPASTTQKSRAPDDKRVEFLATLLGTMRKTARVLLIHGNVRWRGSVLTPGDRWGQTNYRLTAAFLGTDHLDEGDELRIGRQRIRIFRSGCQTALWTWAPGARPGKAYISQVKELVTESLSRRKAVG
jgi:hypothetical protein